MLYSLHRSTRYHRIFTPLDAAMHVYSCGAAGMEDPHQDPIMASWASSSSQGFKLGRSLLISRSLLLFLYLHHLLHRQTQGFKLPSRLSSLPKG